MTRKRRIEARLSSTLAPLHLEVQNESHKHHVPEGSESHIYIIAVSLKFENLTRVARHRLVNNLLQEEFDSGLHALSLQLFTTEEWKEKNKKNILRSPTCKDGFHK